MTWKIKFNEYKVLSNSCDKIMFFCSFCCPKIGSALKLADVNRSVTNGYDNLSKHLSSEYQKLCKSIQDLSTKVDNLCSSESELKNKIEDTSKLINSATSAPNTIVPPAMAAVSIADELADRERRKNNLIVYNLAEGSNSDADKSQFVDLCKAIFDSNIQVTKTVRLGKKSDGKNRPLLVGLEDPSHKAEILSRAPSLRHHAQYKKTYIAPDLTKFQREKNKKLVDELKHRKANGENNLIILNGTIVPRKSRAMAVSHDPVLEDAVGIPHSGSPPASPMNS